MSSGFEVEEQEGMNVQMTRSARLDIWSCLKQDKIRLS
jgi:hypothetical protein